MNEGGGTRQLGYRCFDHAVQKITVTHTINLLFFILAFRSNGQKACSVVPKASIILKGPEKPICTTRLRGRNSTLYRSSPLLLKDEQAGRLVSSERRDGENVRIPALLL